MHVLEPIAVVGSACRFPGGASSPSKLWDLLHHPRDVLRDFPKDRLNLTAFHHPDGEHHGSTDVCNKGYLLEEDSRLFDASFFNINPAEADSMDPQQRLVLETVYQSLEAAGYTLPQVQGSLTSVFLGVMTADYHDIQQRDPETINRYHATGTAKSILSNRVSYYFDLRGPSMTLDTACSSSLAALHLAVQSLRNGESTTAIAAGVNLIFDAAGYVAESKLHMLSPTSRSRMWDAGADGYARGEGVAAVILKPLSEALRCGDHVECIVRETGMNSDGRTTGITMPSATAQTTLIQRTYRNAGLDPLVDRPQFFECHGTGTLAGDPVEARAVRDAFFPPGNSIKSDQTMYCGSIKTVIGHTEGCAGLAGLLKASLLVQNGVIAPNLLFNTLNPAIKPFYAQLTVPTTPVAWPMTANGPRRVSLNSFGFGGTNVHAIVENYVPENKIPREVSAGGQSSDPKFVGPLTLSSEKESSLTATIQDFANFIKANPSVDLEDLAYVTQTRRTPFSVRAFFSGETRAKLLQFMEAAVETAKTGAEVGIRPPTTVSSEPPAILGIFTGQGAQWAAMGRSMIELSSGFRKSIQKCEEALQDIPNAPTWSLMQELVAPEESSRISEAAISQPLCTAIQVAIVDVLATAGVHFDAVVGHSSGEIAAVYTAGLISAVDAMRIAYYRGLYAKLATGPNGTQGAMLAIGLGYEDAVSFCNQPDFKGRIGVAASNSSTSTTLSGDKDAVMEAKELLEGQGTFARLLKVDTAYHSHHMLASADSYLNSLKACKIKVEAYSGDCVWISSVYGHAEMLDYEEDLSALSGQYWVDNMVKPVLFSEATECSLWRAGPFNLSLEIGPHPALKGPASQTMKTALGTILPYATFLRRGYNDVEAFSGGVGYIWSYIGSTVDFVGYSKAIRGRDWVAPKMLKGLPSYSFNHDKIHWKEARLSRRYRLAECSPHELLGRRTGDDADADMRWRNILKLNELPWVRGHEFQGQILFPTSGYMAMAIQAAIEIAGQKPIKLIEIRNLLIPRALTIGEDNVGIESVFTLKKLESDTFEGTRFNGQFVCYTSASDAVGALEKNCTGDLTIEFGQSTDNALPHRSPGKSGTVPVDTEEYYDSLLNIGLNYQGLFRGLKSVNRSMGYATTKASWLKSDVGDQYVIHPGPLDVAFHSIIAAFCTPQSGALWAPYLPVKVDRLALVPDINYEGIAGEINFDVDTFITKATPNIFEGDVHIISPDGRTGLQAEGLTLKLFTEARPADDRQMFSKTVWEVDLLGTSSNLDEIEPDEEELALAEAIDRTSLYYINKIFAHLEDADVEGWKWFHKAFYNASKSCLEKTRTGTHATAQREWLNDTEELIMKYQAKYSQQADIKLIHAVAENLVGVMTADVQLLEVMLVENMLSNLYTDGRAMKPLNAIIAKLMQNLSHKHPRLKILEIGAGTGGTTNSVLGKLGTAYGQYTYTDISTGFFENAKQRFSAHSERMVYKVLNIEKDPLEQDLEEGSQDIILASNVLHATRDLKETLAHTRKLLKPGGYLIMMEVTGEFLQMMFLMGGLPGWWLGIDEGRVNGPGIDLTQWDELLRETGFTGADKYVTDLPDSLKHACSVIVSQAVDEKFTMLQEPLTFLDEMPLEERLLVIGGKTLPISRMVKSIEKLAGRFTDQVMLVDSIDGLKDKHMSTDMSVICLSELEKPLFSEPLTSTRLEKLQRLLENATNVLWLTSGRLDENAYSNMSVGLGRALITEIPQLNLQFLDVMRSSTLDARYVVDMFLKLKLAKSPDFTDAARLWSTEPEIALWDDVLYIPRVVMDKERNDRLNCLRRAITRDVRLDEITVVISTSEDIISLEAQPKRLDSPLDMATSNVNLHVWQSIALPHLNNSPFILSTGRIDGSDNVAVAITHQQSSKINLSIDNVFTCSCQSSFNPGKLRSLAMHLTARALCSSITAATPTDAYVVIYEASNELIHALHMMETKHKLVFATSKTQSKSSGPLVHLHPKASIRTIQRLLPRSVSHIVDLSSTQKDQVKTHLLRMYELVEVTAALLDGGNQRQMLKEVFEAVEKSTSSSSYEPIIALQDLPSLPTACLQYPTVVDWTSGDKVVNVSVRPINGDGMFSAEKTYLMVGLVSDLGRSICHWMIENGAKYIVLTSRRAEVDALWLREMESLGASITVAPMDVSKRESVQAVCNMIKDTLPPVGGVCNGALVLKDQLFVEMETDALTDVFAPKVDGTIHLHEIFSESTLDFFVLFSSMSSVVGNAGQSNYNAASLFQAAIANQRRKKGLAASVMSLGMVADVGYIAQRGPSLMEKLKKVFYMPISEADMLLIFAEAVLASKPGNTTDGTIEMVSGIQPFNYNASTKMRPPWFANPRFSHFVREEESQEAVRGQVSNVHVKQQMDVAGSEDEAASVLLAAFAAKLESMLQMSPGSLNVGTPLLDVGTDSLLAVEIRTWFLKEIHVDVPVLKTLGGDNARDICAEAAKKYLSAKMPEGGKATGVVEEEQLATKLNDGEDGLLVPRPDFSERPISTDASSAVSSVGGSTPGKAGTQTPPSTIDDSGAEAEREREREKEKEKDITRVEQLSFAQSRIWFMNRLSKDHTTHNSVYAYKLKGVVQLPRLKRAVAAVVAHHDALHTCFFTRPGTGEPAQSLLKEPPNCFKHIPNPDDGTLDRELEALKRRKWHLKDGDVFQAVLITHSPGESSLLIAYHHIVMDGVSVHLFMRDMNAVYIGKSLSHRAKQYMDLTVDERNVISSGGMDSKVQYWKQEHSPPADVLPLMQFARVKHRPAMDSYANVEAYRDLGSDLADRIKKASQRLRVTPFHFYLSAMQVLLNRLLGVDDMCIGVTDANRDEESSEAIGFFLNLLPIRFKIAEGDRYCDLVNRTSRQFNAGQAHSHVPLDLILEKANVARDMTYTPLFQVVLNFRQGNFSQLPLGNCKLEFEAGLDARSPYDIVFNITPADGTCYLQIVTRADLYSQSSTNLILDMYATLLEDAAHDSSKVLSAYHIHNKAGIEKAVALGQGRVVDFKWPTTLTQRFDDMVKKHANDIAIKDEQTEMTYVQLSEMVDRVSTALVDGGVKKQSRIAVLCEPSGDWVINMLAILRIGAVYVPLDDNLPDERLVAILEACDPMLIVCHNATGPRAKKLAGSHPTLNMTKVAEGRNIPNLECVGEPTFVLFTSGSTGTPKGIELSSAGIVNYLATKKEKLSFDREVVLQQSALGFDMSIAQAFNALAHGGTLIVAPHASRGDPVALSKLMVEEDITFTLGTPTEYLMLLRYGNTRLRQSNSWQNACSGGEVISGQLKSAFQLLHQPPTVTDCYGPTEISCCATMRTVELVEPEGAIGVPYGSIGMANPNTSIYIMDDAGNPVPAGVPGEICIGGVGVALGYLDLRLSNENFVPDRLTKAETANSRRAMYRTRDKGLLLPDGSVQFMGRLDDDTTVKLRGLRIDLEDIAATILRTFNDSISDAIVTLRGEPAFIVAHVVLAEDSVLNAEDLQSVAAALPLPQYMRPSRVIPLNRLPMSSHGKVDRRKIASLPLPAITCPSSSIGKRMNLTEGQLRLLWNSVLRQTKINASLDRESDFFLVGGTSLLLVMLQASIKTSMSVTLPLKDMYHASTLGGMAALIDGRKSAQWVPGKIDWQKETALSGLPSFEIQIARSQKTGKKLEILLTGSHGFLGNAILSSLLNNPSVSRVHCVAVDFGAADLLPEDDRITAYEGSLSEPTLGLKPPIYTKLQAAVDAIILAGAQGHCLNSYASLRVSNYHSTREMAMFALPRRIPIHYMSSNRVTLLDVAAKASLPPVSAAEHLPNQDGLEGFTAAKWAGEVFLEKLGQATLNSEIGGHKGLPVVIHRPCAVVGDRAPLEDALNALLRYSRLIQAVPRLSGLNVDGYFDFRNIDEVASEISKQVIESIGQDHSKVTYKHYSSGVRVRPDEFRSYMEKTYGGTFQELSLDEWIDAAREEGIEELIVSYLQAVTDRGERMVFPFMGQTISD